MNVFTVLVLPITLAILVAILGKVLGFYIEDPDKFSIIHYARRVETYALLIAVTIIIFSVSFQVAQAAKPVVGHTNIVPSLPTGTLNCVSGSLAIDGSTALSPLVKAVAEDYMAKCPKATITVSGSSSSTGLSTVESGKIDIADSDLSALPTQGDLIDHRVAVVIFAVVTSPDINVTTLNTDQLRGIYNGTIGNWDKVGGPDKPIHVFTRVSSSGTRTTFDKYIICTQETPQASVTHQVATTDLMAKGVQQTAGAIGYLDVGAAQRAHLNILHIDGQFPLQEFVKLNLYKFWKMEHMYTKGLPGSNSLTNAFLQYMTNTSEENLIAAQLLSYVNFNDMSNSGLSSHQSCQ